jgi:hypothetical protein
LLSSPVAALSRASTAPRSPERQQHRDQHRGDALQQVPQGQLLLAGAEADRFQHGDQVGQQAGDVQGDDGPYQAGEDPLELQQPGGADQAQAQHVEHQADDRQRTEQRQRQREQPDVHPLLRQRARHQQQHQRQQRERRPV